MDSILPERLPALVRPAFDLVLRRIRSLKRCVQVCGCKIMTPRYAPQFGSRLHFKRCQPLPKETLFFGDPFFWDPFFLLFWFFLSPAKVGSLSLESVSQMDSILPERLPALVRPAFDLVLRRIRSLKRCVQACGCKIMTPRYAPQFGSRLHFKRCQPLPKETLFFGDPFFWDPFFSFFWFFLGSLEMQPGAKLQAYLGVIILQPHACTQRFRLRILRRTRSNAGRTSAGSLSGRIESIWETPSKERARGARPSPRPAQREEACQ